MSPFTKPQASPKPAHFGGLFSRTALVVFLACAVAGVAIVAWRANAYAGRTRALARAEVLARAAALELQFNSAISAAEVLGALAQQNGGPIPNFQAVATQLRATRPLLASLELQPGGVVSDVVPRAGNERVLGLNVLKDPAQRQGANLAAQSRALTVSAPVALEGGQPGIVARVPIYQRGRDGRDYFWGFVATSLRIPDAMNAAQADELWINGYSYALSAPIPGPRKAITLVRRGDPVSGAVSAPVKVRNFEFNLDAKPLGGWVSITGIVAELLVVLAFAGLAALLVTVVQDRRGAEGALEETNQRLAREIADRKRAQEELQTAKDGLATAQAESRQASQALHQAETLMTELQSLVETTARESSEAAEANRAKLESAERHNNELQAQLQAAMQGASEAAKVSRAEMDQSQSLLAQAQQTIHQMRERLEAALAVERDATASAQAQAQRDQVTIAELRARLETTVRSAQEAAAASDALLAELEASNSDLKARLAAAEPWEGRVAELTSRLQKAEALLERQHNSAAFTSDTVVTYQEDATAVDQNGETALEKPTIKDDPAPPLPELPQEPVASASETPPSTQPVEETIVVFQDEVASPETSTVAGTESTVPETPTDPVTIEVSAEPAALPSSTPEAPEPPPKPAKPSKRKKTRRSNQMDLFGSPASTQEEFAEPLETKIQQASARVEIPEGPISETDRNAADTLTPQSTESTKLEPEPVVTGETEPSSAPNLEGGSAESAPALEADAATGLPAEEEKQKPTRRPPAPPPFDAALFRKATSLIVPLLSDGDPGAKDCLKDNRTTFRSGFSPEVYLEFEQAIKSADYETALDHLRKAARKHGIPA